MHNYAYMKVIEYVAIWVNSSKKEIRKNPLKIDIFIKFIQDKAIK